jgi:hypothetical protein
MGKIFFNTGYYSTGFGLIQMFPQASGPDPGGNHNSHLRTPEAGLGKSGFCYDYVHTCACVMAMYFWLSVMVMYVWFVLIVIYLLVSVMVM